MNPMPPFRVFPTGGWEECPLVAEYLLIPPPGKISPVDTPRHQIFTPLSTKG